jgi:hypothetical protein
MDFIFENYAFDPKSGVLTLRYAYTGGPAFEETITFPTPLPNYNKDAADRMFRLVFLLAGVSYYKAKVPPRCVCKAFKLDDATAIWLEKVYRLGLAEFAYKNKLDVAPVFESTNAQPPEPLALALPPRALVPVGGGKDSIVTLEALRDLKPTLFALGGPGGAAQPIADTIKVSGMNSIYVSRRISPKLLEMNAQGAYNGHVPITAILSTIALTCAVLYGYDSVVMSNEHSASAPNFDDVNHQYSKSFEFEQELAGYVRAFISPGLQYFSFLRPLTEVAIAQRFSKLTKYHDIFRSCNTAFKQDEAARGKKWCCHCPKCRFVFLALAPFMDKQKLVSIFGQNLLDDPAQTQGFAELCGVSAFKPFECVGDVAESAAAMQKLSTMKAWQDDVVVETLSHTIDAPHFDQLFKPYPDHALPLAYLERLNEGQ